MFLALVTALVGSPGAGLLLLIIGGAEHVARHSIEGFLEEKQGSAF
jgi:hypothetical protein